LSVVLFFLLFRFIVAFCCLKGELSVPGYFVAGVGVCAATGYEVMVDCH